MPTHAKCLHCGKVFTPATYWQRYCSKKCRVYVSVNSYRERKGLFKTRRPRAETLAAVLGTTLPILRPKARKRRGPPA